MTISQTQSEKIESMTLIKESIVKIDTIVQDTEFHC